ncbi:MAG: hypothetical protein Q9162_003854 [Coniocarpon cinnabarinum]
MGALQSTYLHMEEVSNKKQKQRAAKFAASSRGQRMQNSSRMKRYTAERDKALRKGADLRAAQEADDSTGERVWFSRCILNGRLQHWVLITYGTKYELRRDRNVGPGDEAQYVCNIRPYSIDQERRDMALTELGIPDVDGYYVCLIGWTQLPKEQVDAACHETLAGFGEYKLLRNNCQHFLKAMAARILKDTAADYGWFMSNTKTQYQKDQWLRPPPAEMMMHILARQQQALNIANQNQLQTQTQMQLQMQNQLQMQMQMQMQTQMMTQAGGMGA